MEPNIFIAEKTETIGNLLLKMSCRRLLKQDFNRDCQELSRSFLGKVLVRKLDDGSVLKGRIVETECYLGGEDKASHSYGGR